MGHTKNNCRLFIIKIVGLMAFLIGFTLLINSVFAVEWVPIGDIQLKNNYSIYSAVYFNATTICFGVDCRTSWDATSGDTNESTRFEALVDTDCTDTQKALGIYSNGTIFCGADNDTVYVDTALNETILNMNTTINTLISENNNSLTNNIVIVGDHNLSIASLDEIMTANNVSLDNLVITVTDNNVTLTGLIKETTENNLSLSNLIEAYSADNSTINTRVNENNNSLTDLISVHSSDNSTLFSLIGLRALISDVVNWISGNRTESESQLRIDMIGNSTKVLSDVDTQLQGNISASGIAIRTDIDSNYTDLNDRKLNISDDRYNETGWVVEQNYHSNTTGVSCSSISGADADFCNDADTVYNDGSVNETISGVNNTIIPSNALNDSYLRIGQNETTSFDDTALNETASGINNTIIPSISLNESYLRIGQNETTPFDDTAVNITTAGVNTTMNENNASLTNLILQGFFNTTYDNFAYNQTTPAITYVDNKGFVTSVEGNSTYLLIGENETGTGFVDDAINETILNLNTTIIPSIALNNSYLLIGENMTTPFDDTAVNITVSGMNTTLSENNISLTNLIAQGFFNISYMTSQEGNATYLLIGENETGATYVDTAINETILNMNTTLNNLITDNNVTVTDLVGRNQTQDAYNNWNAVWSVTYLDDAVNLTILNMNNTINTLISDNNNSLALIITAQGADNSTTNTLITDNNASLVLVNAAQNADNTTINNLVIANNNSLADIIPKVVLSSELNNSYVRLKTDNSFTLSPVLANLTNCNTIDTDAQGNLACGTDTGGSMVYDNIAMTNDSNNFTELIQFQNQTILFSYSPVLHNLTSCDTIDTDSIGNLVCGTDASAAGGMDYTNVSMLNETEEFTENINFTANVSIGSGEEEMLNISTNGTDAIFETGLNAYFSGKVCDSIGCITAASSFDDTSLNETILNMNTTLTTMDTDNNNSLTTEITTSLANNQSLSNVIAAQSADNASINALVTANNNSLADIIPKVVPSTDLNNSYARLKTDNSFTLSPVFANLTGCDTIDSDANGNLVCGADAGASDDLTNVAFLNNTANFTGFTQFTNDTILFDKSPVFYNLTSCDVISSDAGGNLYCTTDDTSAGGMDYTNLAMVNGTNNFTEWIHFQNQTILFEYSPVLYNLTSCDTIDTDAQGNLVCGTDTTFVDDAINATIVSVNDSAMKLNNNNIVTGNNTYNQGTNNTWFDNMSITAPNGLATFVFYTDGGELHIV